MASFQDRAQHAIAQLDKEVSRVCVFWFCVLFLLPVSPQSVCERGFLSTCIVSARLFLSYNVYSSRIGIVGELEDGMKSCCCSPISAYLHISQPPVSKLN